MKVPESQWYHFITSKLRFHVWLKLEIWLAQLILWCWRGNYWALTEQKSWIGKTGSREWSLVSRVGVGTLGTGSNISPRSVSAPAAVVTASLLSWSMESDCLMSMLRCCPPHTPHLGSFSVTGQSRHNRLVWLTIIRRCPSWAAIKRCSQLTWVPALSLSCGYESSQSPNHTSVLHLSSVAQN